MKLLFATPIYPPEIGGPATYVKELCDHLGMTHEITIVAYTDEKTPFSNTQLIPVSKKDSLPVRLLKYTFQIWKTSHNTDVMYVQNAMASGLPVALVSMFRNKPFILKFVGDEAWERATQRHETSKTLEEFYKQPEGSFRIKLMMFIQGFVLRRATIVTTPSEYLMKEIIGAYSIDPKRTVVNYNAAEYTNESTFDNTLNKKHQILTTARLVPWKGIDGIIHAVGILKKKIPDVTLVIAGDGPELETLKKLAHNLTISENISFLGNVSRTETRDLRKKSEVYVLNSTYEGLPHTVLTSFDAMIPTVTTNTPGTNEAVYHEKTGLLVTPGNNQELADAIERIFNDKELARNLTVNAKKLLQEKFSWEAHLRILNSLFASAEKKH